MPAKSTTLDPNAINVSALQKAVEKFKANESEIVRTTERKKALDIEVADYLASIDPDDEKALHLISLRRTQAEVLPGFTQRAIAKGPVLLDAIFTEIKVLEKIMADAEMQSRRAYEDDLGKGISVLKVSFFEGFARDEHGRIGLKSTDIAESSRSEYPAQFETAVLVRAEELLELAPRFTPYVQGAVKVTLAKLFGLKAA